jgi:inhibitor of cysteine peptidase
MNIKVSEVITIRKGKEFSISLESNPTSGFSWFPCFEDSAIKLISHKFQPLVSNVAGGSGKEFFVFVGLRSGTTSLRLSYKRSWEQQIAIEKNFVIKIE